MTTLELIRSEYISSNYRNLLEKKALFASILKGSRKCSESLRKKKAEIIDFEKENKSSSEVTKILEYQNLLRKFEEQLQPLGYSKRLTLESLRKLCEVYFTVITSLHEFDNEGLPSLEGSTSYSDFSLSLKDFMELECKRLIRNIASVFTPEHSKSSPILCEICQVKSRDVTFNSCCRRLIKDTTETVNGLPQARCICPQDDYPVCSECFFKSASENVTRLILSFINRAADQIPIISVDKLYELLKFHIPCIKCKGIICPLNACVTVKNIAEELRDMGFPSLTDGVSHSPAPVVPPQNQVPVFNPQVLENLMIQNSMAQQSIVRVTEMAVEMANKFCFMIEEHKQKNVPNNNITTTMTIDRSYYEGINGMDYIPEQQPDQPDLYREIRTNKSYQQQQQQKRKQKMESNEDIKQSGGKPKKARTFSCKKCGIRDQHYKSKCPMNTERNNMTTGQNTKMKKYNAPEYLDDIPVPAMEPLEDFDYDELIGDGVIPLIQ